MIRRFGVNVFGVVAIVAGKIGQGPDPIAVAEAVEHAVADPKAPIRVPAGAEAVTVVPLAGQPGDEELERKVKAALGIPRASGRLIPAVSLARLDPVFA